MFAVERRNRINELLIEKRSVKIAEMAESFKVSSQTIRRDFEILEKDGILVRTYGGAYIREGIVSNIDINIRQNMVLTSKVAIAEQCVSLIRAQDSIFLDNSSTALTVAHKLPDIDIKVITNSLLVANHVAQLKNVELIGIGGTLNKVNMCYVGKAAIDMMSCYFVDKAFISGSTLNMENGVIDSNEEVAAIRSLAVANAIQSYLIVDHTKFNKTSLVKVCGFDEIEGIITDKSPGSTWKEFLKEKKISLYY